MLTCGQPRPLPEVPVEATLDEFTTPPPPPPLPVPACLGSPVASPQLQVRAESAPSLEGSRACRGKPPLARQRGGMGRLSALLTVSPLSVPSCEPFSIYTPWGERCEHLSLKLGAFFGILFGALSALLLLGVVLFVLLRFWGWSGTRFSYPLGS